MSSGRAMRIHDPAAVRSLLVRDARSPAIPADVFDAVSRTGAILEGHFLLLSGDHSQYFLRFADVGWDSRATDRIAALLLERSGQQYANSKVMCSESAGLFLGIALARRLQAPLIISKTDQSKRPTGSLSAGSAPLSAGDAVTIVSDVITRGKSLRRMIETVRRANATPKAVLSFASLLPTELNQLLREENVAGHWLVDAAWKTFDSGSCPLCAQGQKLLPGFELA